MSVDEIVAELNEVARAALLGQLIFMPEAGRYLCWLGLIDMGFIDPGPLGLGYVLTDLGTEMAEACNELRRAEWAVRGSKP